MVGGVGGNSEQVANAGAGCGYSLAEAPLNELFQQIHELIRPLLDIEGTIRQFVSDYGLWTYAIIGLIIFCETGLVILPFLPGDSLLFTCGALSASGILNLWLVSAIILICAIVGDAVNYSIGRYLSDRVLAGKKIPLVKKQHIDRTHEFFEKYGPKAIVLARFVPIVRTFAPFVAGVGRMRYSTFTTYNIVGAIAWTVICVGAGVLFGNLPWVKKNFEAVVIGIIVVSVMPMVVEYWLAKRRAKKIKATAGQ